LLQENIPASRLIPEQDAVWNRQIRNLLEVLSIFFTEFATPLPHSCRDRFEKLPEKANLPGRANNLPNDFCSSAPRHVRDVTVSGFGLFRASKAFLS
jgi:hypothetical protein